MELAFIMSDSPKTLGDRLREARKAKGLSQTDLADIVGMRQQSIANIEKLSTSSLKMSEIADALGVSVRFLQTGKDEPIVSLVEDTISKKGNSYSLEEIIDALPMSCDRTISTVRNFLFHQGKLVNGDIPVIENKDLFLNVLINVLKVELTGDLLSSNLDADTLTKSVDN